MNHPTGENTQDLIALGQPHPAEQGLTPEQRESTVLRHGRRCRTAGVTILSALYILCLALAVASDNGRATSSNSELFYVLAMMAAAITGGMFLMAGFAERREQPVRAMLRQNRTQLDEQGRRLDTIMGLVAAVPGRLDALEDVIEKVPTFEDGVELGTELRRALRGQDRL